MEYLRIRRGERQRRSDGSRFAVPLVIKKTRKYGKVLSEKAVTRKRCLLIVGAHDSGKSQWLRRMHEHSAEIWSKHKSPALMLPALQPIGAWTEANPIEDWWNSQQENETLAQSVAEDSGMTSSKPRKRWESLRQWEKVEAMPQYVADTNPVVFIDDAHKLTGRKLDVARRCLLPAQTWVVSANQENRIAPNLRTPMMRRDPKLFKLGSETAYDYTSALMWGFVGLATIAGWWELAMVMGGIKLLSSGRRASKQD